MVREFFGLLLVAAETARITCGSCYVLRGAAACESEAVSSAIWAGA
jgi:hypothetical protein